jgi:ATP-dependent DNA ligase
MRACLETLPDLVINGELVVLDEQGRPQFEPLSRRLAMRDPKSIAHAVKVTPTVVFAFDLGALRGKDLRAMPLLMRKEIAEGGAEGRHAHPLCAAHRRERRAALPGGRRPRHRGHRGEAR